ncbi:MAG: dihydroorotate dehydrogenase [Desulfobacterales bacterium]|nr:dihydroorotate dehydrogenase [Desulfobacterales bacterium]MCP4160297.1 dihydroorotate dehydrogenase [Deltaproteobacteria bacterium]
MHNKNCKTIVTIGNIKLKTPVMTASGTFGYGREFSEVTDLNKLGAIITKGLSLEPSKGNPNPRVVETTGGLLNAVGLENVGFDVFKTDKLPFLETLETPFIVNIYGKTEEDYEAITQKLNEIPSLSGIEVNISCPNVKEGGVAFGVDPVAAASIVSKIRAKTNKTLIVKLSPNVTDIAAIAKSVEGAGADAVSLINTLTGMLIDIKTRKPRLANVTGGLSGPAIKPVALRMVWEVAKVVKIPVIGVGGITCADDAIEFIIAGATAVQVGTGNLVDPKTAGRVAKGIEKYLIKNNFSGIDELRGSLNLK